MWWIYVSRFVCSSLFLFFLFVPDLAFLPVAETSRLIRLGFRRVIIPDDTGFRFTIGWMASDLGGIPRGGAGLREEKSRERLNGEGGAFLFSSASRIQCAFWTGAAYVETRLRIIMAK